MKNKIQIRKQLESYYGIGKNQSKLICNQLGISSLLRINQFTQYEKNQIMQYLRKRMKIIDNPLCKKNINKLPVGENLKFLRKNSILFLIQKNTYKGFRHKKGLPVRGQRTRSNRQTIRKLFRKF